MNYTLRSSQFEFTLNPDHATWSLHGTQGNAPFIEDAWMRVRYLCDNMTYEALQNWQGAEFQIQQIPNTPHGPMQNLTFRLGPDKNGLHFTVEFALIENDPLCLMKVILENQGTKKIEIEQIKLFQAGFFPTTKRFSMPEMFTNRGREHPQGKGAVRPNPAPGELTFFSNGWQSWSFTGALNNTKKFPYTRLGFLTRSIWYNPGTPRTRKRGHFSSDMFGVLSDRQHRTGILAGFLSQKEHFGSLEASTNPLYPALALWANGDNAILKPGHRMCTDWAAIQLVNLNEPDPLAPYVEAVAREHHLPAFPSGTRQGEGLRLGWCSWYQFFQDISAEKMRNNLKTAEEMHPNLPLDLFQIDDGFEAQVGDWLDFSPDFPEGVAPLAKEIRAAGYTPGLWLAPYIVHSKAKLKREHPDWLLRNHWKRPVNAGFVWNNLNTALDLTHPEALEYTREVVHTAAHKWGFTFLKLDFLYAAAIQGVYQDRTKTRAQVLRMGLETLREAAGPDVHMLGCGSPLGSSIGIFESMRIGADVDQRWEPYINGSGTFLYKEFSVPSARNAIQNTLTRAFLHQRWWVNDPDCLLVRPDSQLTLAEIQSLATTIALSGGPLLISDDLPKLPPDRLRIAQQLVPIIGKIPRVIDIFESTTPRKIRLDLDNTSGKWHLVAVFNWADSPADVNFSLNEFSLPPGDYFAREFWSSDLNLIENGQRTLKNMPSHGVKLLALRPVQEGQACYLGSDLHISQGLEVTQWSETPSNLKFRLERPGKVQGEIDLYLPQPPDKITINKKETEWQKLENRFYRLQVEFQDMAEIEIR